MAFDDAIDRLLAESLTDLRARIAVEGFRASAIGLSLFLVGEEPRTETAQFSAFAGEQVLLGMFAPEWPFALSRDLLEEPTETFEGDDGDPLTRRDVEGHG